MAYLCQQLEPSDHKQIMHSIIIIRFIVENQKPRENRA